MNQYVLERIKDGRQWRKGDRIVYTGPLRQKPTGWRVVQRLGKL
jgi:hypothetical protein